jgi:hypothetical protein
VKPSTRLAIGALSIFGVAALVSTGKSPSAHAAEGPPWRVERGDVRVTVPLKPGGAFAATSTALAGTVRLADAAASGKPLRLVSDIALDLNTIDTGITLRNQHLRENYLETGKGAGYDKAVLSNVRLADGEGESFSGSSAFTASLLLHGVSHEVSGKAEVKAEGNGRRVKAEFPLELTDFGIAVPMYLGVGVGSRLLVKVEFTATLPAGSARD